MSATPGRATPDVKWTVTDPVTVLFVTDAVTGVNIGNTWLVEGGVGCGSGARGVRGEFMIGYHGKRNIDGTPGPWNPDGAAGPPIRCTPRSPPPR